MATGTGNLPYPGKVYNPFDILTAEELNEDVSNIESLADGSGIGDGAIGSSSYGDGSIEYIKLLSTIFSSQMQSQANAGSAGGTMYYINLGGIKLLWLITNATAVGTGGTTLTVTLPTSFFSSIRYVSYSPVVVTTTNNQRAIGDGFTTSSLTFTIVSATNGSTQRTGVLVIGA